MYSAVLTIHSWMRWITLILAAAATMNALRHPSRRRDRLPRAAGGIRF